MDSQLDDDKANIIFEYFETHDVHDAIDNDYLKRNMS